MRAREQSKPKKPRFIGDNQDRDLVLRRKKEKSLDYNNSFLGEYECSSLALDREDRRDEKKRLDHLKQDQIILSFADSMARRSILVRVLDQVIVRLGRFQTVTLHGSVQYHLRIGSGDIGSQEPEYNAQEDEILPTRRRKPLLIACTQTHMSDSPGEEEPFGDDADDEDEDEDEEEEHPALADSIPPVHHTKWGETEFSLLLPTLDRLEVIGARLWVGPGNMDYSESDRT
ncbi:hypothetical protein Tco_0818873 [Tanacetum coccineum]